MKKTATHDHTRSLLLLTIVLIPCAFLWQAFNSFVMFKQIVLNVLVALSASAVLIRKEAFRIPRWSIPITLFAGVALLLGLGSAQPIFASLNALMIMVYVVFGILLHDTFYRKPTTPIIETLLYTTAAVSVIGILQFFGNGFLSPYTDLPGKWRVFSTFGNPSFLAAFITGVLPLSIHNYLKKKDVEALLLFLVPTLCLVLTFARASWISSMVVLILWAVISKKLSAKHLFLAGLVVILLITGISAARQDFRKHLLNMDSWKGRAFLWMVGTSVIRDHAAIGVGLNQFRTHHLKYQHDILIAHPKLIDRFKPFAPVEEFCHNDYIQIAAETGIIGILFMCYMLGALFVALKKQAAHPFTPAFAALLGIGAICVNALFFFPFYLPPILFLITLLLVIAYAGDHTGHIHRLSGLSRCSLIGICIIIASLSITTLISDLYLKKGTDALAHNDIKRAEIALRNAVTLDPWSGENQYFLARTLFFQNRCQEAEHILEAALSTYPNYFVYSLLAFVYNYNSKDKHYERVITFLHSALPGQRISIRYGLALE